MVAPDRAGVSIGVTYAVRHLKTMFTALGWAYGSTWGPDAHAGGQ
jgi:hypothetical protein